MTGKPKERIEKSEQELENAYIAKVEHSMERFEMWSEKLVKLVRSRKSYLSEKDKTKLAEDYYKLALGISSSLRAKGQVTKESGYRLR